MIDGLVLLVAWEFIWPIRVYLLLYALAWMLVLATDKRVKRHYVHPHFARRKTSYVSIRSLGEAASRTQVSRLLRRVATEKWQAIESSAATARTRFLSAYANLLVKTQERK